MRGRAMFLTGPLGSRTYWLPSNPLLQDIEIAAKKVPGIQGERIRIEAIRAQHAYDQRRLAYSDETIGAQRIEAQPRGRLRDQGMHRFVLSEANGRSDRGTPCVAIPAHHFCQGG